MNTAAEVPLVSQVEKAVTFAADRPQEALEASRRFIEHWVLPGGMRLVGAAAIVIVGSYLAGYLGRLTRYAAERVHVDPTLRGALGSLVHYTLMVFTFVAALRQFGVDTTAFVAVLGAAGLAIGLSLQGTLSNVAAGALLLLLRPFSIGDAVRVSTGIEGNVKRVDLFTSELITPDGVHISLPNAAIWGAMISNFSHAPVRTVVVRFYVACTADLRRALQVLQETADAEPGFLREREAPVADVDKNTTGHVELVIRGPVPGSEHAAVSAALRRKGLYALQDADIAPPPAAVAGAV